MVQLFKSKKERELERKMAVRKARLNLEKYISECKKDINGFIETARKAHAIGNKKQVEIARKAVNKSFRQQRIAETQLINLKLAEQMQNQVQAHKQFSDAMKAVIKSVAEAFKDVKLHDFEKDLTLASYRADELNEKMEMFLENSADAILGESREDGYEADDELGSIEFEQLIKDSVHNENDELSQKIREKMNEVEKALGKM